MNSYDDSISYFAKTNFRNEGQHFGFYSRDRIEGGGILITGQVGTGKTSTLKNICIQDLSRNDVGCFVADLHSDIIADLLKFIPKERQKDVIHINLSDPNLAFGYNPIRCGLPKHMRSMVASSILEAFKKLWDKRDFGSRMESILRSVLLTLLDQKSANIADIRRILLDENYRKTCIENISSSSEELKAFWLHEFPLFSLSSLLTILTKINALLSHPLVYNFLIQNKKQVSILNAMQNSKIIFLSLDRGKIGSDPATLIAGILLNAITVSGFTRTGLPDHKKPPFHLYLDEYGFYASRSSIDAINQLRKANISAIYVSQYLSLIDKDIREAMLGSIANIVAFRAPYDDARIYAQLFHPHFHHSDFSSLNNHEIILKMLIKGKVSKGFTATTLEFPVLSPTLKLNSSSLGLQADR